MLKVTIVMYRATGGAVLCRAVLKSNVSCRVELYRALLHCGSSRRNPDRTDLGSKLELPEGIARASCNRSARGARPARAQDHIQFRSPRSIHRRPKPDRTNVDLKVELLEARSRRAVGAQGTDRDVPCHGRCCAVTCCAEIKCVMSR